VQHWLGLVNVDRRSVEDESKVTSDSGVDLDKRFDPDSESDFNDDVDSDKMCQIIAYKPPPKRKVNCPALIKFVWRTDHLHSKSSSLRPHHYLPLSPHPRGHLSRTGHIGIYGGSYASLYGPLTPYCPETSWSLYLAIASSVIPRWDFIQG
jgi:hypothetical protein